MFVIWFLNLLLLLVSWNTPWVITIVSLSILPISTATSTTTTTTTTTNHSYNSTTTTTSNSSCYNRSDVHTDDRNDNSNDPSCSVNLSSTVDDTDLQLVSKNTGTCNSDQHSGDTSSVDESLSSSQLLVFYKENSIKVLKERKAHLCWHKHSTFLEHLISVHDVLRHWMMYPRTVADPPTDTTTENSHPTTTTTTTTAATMLLLPRIGLFHSAYSNSYVNLALFNVTTERQIVQDLIGTPAEEYVYIFCSINRQDVVVNTLLRQQYIPPNGIVVPHLRHTNQTIYLSSHTLYLLLIFTMADIADQYFDWQDQLFGGGNTYGSMILPGYDLFLERHNTKALWPGLSKPGLWMSYVSQLGQVARTYRRNNSTGSSDHHTMTPPIMTSNHTNTTNATTWNILPIFPPVFESGTKVIQPQDEIIARDLYWSVISGEISNDDDIIVTLQSCIEHNPYIFEPLVVLSQVYAHQNNFHHTIRYSTRAIELQQQWGMIAWDKRMSYDAWVAWTKVLLQRAQQQLPWPTNAWDVNNLGYVH